MELIVLSTCGIPLFQTNSLNWNESKQSQLFIFYNSNICMRYPLFYWLPPHIQFCLFKITAISIAICTFPANFRVFTLKSKGVWFENLRGPPNIPWPKRLFFSTQPERFWRSEIWVQKTVGSEILLAVSHQLRYMKPSNWCKKTDFWIINSNFPPVRLPPKCCLPSTPDTAALFFQPLQHRRDQSPNEAPQLGFPLTTAWMIPLLVCQSS